MMFLILIVKLYSKIMSKQKARLIAQHEFVLLPTHREKFVDDNVTVPDESYSVRELLEKFSRGMMPPNVMKAGQYDPAAFF